LIPTAPNGSRDLDSRRHHMTMPRTTLPFSLVLLLALALGAFTVLAFAPFGFWPLQIITLALIFRLVLRATSVGRGALIGCAYSAGWIGCGVHWLYISMHDYGGLPGWMAACAVALLAVCLGSLAGLAMGGALWLKQRWCVGPTATALLLLPSAWALAEWSRGWIFTGFPWVSSGYAHNASPLAGFAPLLGVYGLAWLSALIAGCLILLRAQKLVVLAAALLLVAGAGLRSVNWTRPHGAPISVRLLQGNVPQEMKFAPEQLEATLAMYSRMITVQPADLIATPETALPLLSSQLPPDYLAGLQNFSRQSGSHVILGIATNDGPRQYANSVLGLNPAAGATTYRYDKHHLVPFGEFIPVGARWFVDMMRIPLGDFTRGALLQKPFAVKDQWVMPNICYEDLFGEEIAAQLAAAASSGAPQPTLLLNASNIGWFGDSIAVPQHLQISQMRALETGRPMLRATNTGATAVINPKGDVIARLPSFERGTLAATVQGYEGLTPYSRYGNMLVVDIAFLLLGAAAVGARRRRDNPHDASKTR
jgi:apolipoprotein N-acyltransferase